MNRPKHAKGRRRTPRELSAGMRRLVAAQLVFALITGVAWAYWTVGSVPGGNGASAATSVNQGATPTAHAVGAAVTVTWAATTLTSGQAVTGYAIRRYDAVTPFALQSILSSCAGTIPATSCVENSVPTGTWQYTVTPKIGTNWLGVESAKSTPVLVETVPPTNNITLSSVTGGAYKSSNNIYYRGTASGSFTLTNAVADAGSGPASSQSATLTGTSTGWTHTPSTVSTPSGGPYVSNVFSWASSTTTTPGEVITGRDVSGNTATTTLTTTLDNTAPSAGTVTPVNGYAAGRSVSVSFTTGTDIGSGIATRWLRRASAPLISGTCGSYSSYADLGTVNPTSPYVDTDVSNGNCYKYAYSVTDNVGNENLATSPNVAKVDYAAAVNATAGLLSQWRLGESTAAADTFTGASGTTLTSHAPEIGATWSNLSIPGATDTERISDANRARRNGTGTGGSVSYTTAPTSANYSVEADLVVKSNLAGDMAGVIGRVDTGSAKSFYMARWEQADTSWNLIRDDNGTVRWLNYVTGQPALTVGATYRLRLEMNTTQLRLYVDGVLMVAATDATLSAAGKAGIMDGGTGDYGISAPAKGDTTGIHLDNFSVTPRAADSRGTNDGDYFNGPTLAVAGAIGGDPNTAARFDGVNEYVSVARQISDDFSIEFWFTSTQDAGATCTQWWQGRGMVDAEVYGTHNDFGVSLCAGRVIAGVGNPDTSVVSAAGFNDGAWHHVVLTRTRSSGVLVLYLDGVSAGSATGGTASLTSPPNINFGRLQSGSNYFAGTLDEIAVYNTALPQATVTNHYGLGAAPPGEKPVVTTTGSTLAYTENGTTVLDAGITVTDPDSTNLASATVTMAAAYVNGQDTLAFTNQNGITGTWTPATGVLALTGSATLASYQSALRSVTYNNNSDNPDTTTRTVTFAANDGASNSLAASRTITLTAVNDAPVNSVPGSQTTYENTAWVFSSGNGNLISVSDPDAASSPVQVQLVSTHGTSSLSGTTGLTFTVGDGTADATMTFTGTITSLNLRLAGLSFTPTPSYTGAAGLQIITSDQGNTGTGGTLTDNDTIAITVTYGLFTTTTDIGSGAAGPTSSSYASGVYTEVGNGADIYATTDQFHYLYTSWTGDGTIIARVTSLGGSHPAAKAAVMFRETTSTGSKFAMMDVEPATTNAAEWAYRSITDDNSPYVVVGGISPTIWLKLVRSGNTFTGFTAPDFGGSPGPWTQRGTQSVTMGSTILVGLATLSHSATLTTTATYDHVSLTAP